MPSLCIIALFGTLTFYTLIPSIHTLKCVRCDGPMSNYDCKTTYPAAEECPSLSGGSSNYCSKKETFTSNGNLEQTRRYCNSVAAPSTACTDLKTGGKLCEYSCNTDGCNSVAGMEPTRAVYFIAILMLA
uniref:Omega-scoloptoxin(05)-Ssm1a n=2 Tax=Scolopendra TaxID=41364 RepID=TX51A_SCOMU|nr:RecName: Full=Omega-scoloptoxin(05)-Ssm1a; Short=Omega-SLPTX(05)-Ssm1a; AltName: Full=Omega-scoloptoxin-Ssm1a; Short=Omega-SLPTX-Ssm1a; Flags: Precursor [Scolopendra mutilans]AFM55006.1 omega-SLPTX-Ssm1a neurotoxin precursor [Scolopendra subspinipes]